KPDLVRARRARVVWPESPYRELACAEGHLRKTHARPGLKPVRPDKAGDHRDRQKAGDRRRQRPPRRSRLTAVQRQRLDDSRPQRRIGRGYVEGSLETADQQFFAHPITSWTWSTSGRSCANARCMRDFTVPTGAPTMAATSSMLRSR